MNTKAMFDAQDILLTLADDARGPAYNMLCRAWHHIQAAIRTYAATDPASLNYRAAGAH
jgi:hypothetical protein